MALAAAAALVAAQMPRMQVLLKTVQQFAQTQVLC